MALLTESALRGAARDYEYKTYRFAKSADILLTESAATTATHFDVFLSHSIKDAEVILGIQTVLKNLGLKVYVDWIVDRQLDRTAVTSESAEKLRGRMRQSDCLIYAHSNASGNSKWMPWELGYFDGFRSAVTVLPIATTETNSFAGQEYLGLYPYIDGSLTTLWVNKGAAPQRLYKGPETYKNFSTWLSEQRRSV